MLKKLIGLTIAVLLLFSLAACNQSEDEDMGLKVGFGADAGEPASPIKCAFTSEKSRLKIGEDFTIKLYYGEIGTGYDMRFDPPPIAVSAVLKMGHEIYGAMSPTGGSYASELVEVLTLKEIDDFATPEYLWRSSSEGGWLAATETVVIPANWFVGERGSIGWSVLATIVFPDESPEPEFSEGGGVALYYRIKDENIILYGSYYNFFNDIRK